MTIKDIIKLHDMRHALLLYPHYPLHLHSFGYFPNRQQLRKPSAVTLCILPLLLLVYIIFLLFLDVTFPERSCMKILKVQFRYIIVSGKGE